MRTKRKLLLKQFDNKLKLFAGTEKIIVPDEGWIKGIRKTLNITLEQLGRKLNISKQGVKKIEESECAGSISIKSLKEVAKVLDMQFVYGFVSKNGSLENLVKYKAEELAKRIVYRTNQTMQLENQANSDEQLNKAITDLADDFANEIHRSIWD